VGGEPGAVKRYFCTYFDENYCSRALALLRSLEKHCPSFHLFALCMDDVSYQKICRLQLSAVTPIALKQLEAAKPELLKIKASRSRVEYYWTCGPVFILYALHLVPVLDLITYLDADLFFFSGLQPLYDEMEGSSIGIIEHRFSFKHEKRLKFGIYNVGWLAFRRDEIGLQCLQWWSEKCIEWCFDYVEDSRFGDQKYLDDWPVRFKNVRVIQHKGANVAVWNVANHDIVEQNGKIFVDDQPLIFFHFHGFKRLAAGLYDSNLGRSGYRPPKHVRRGVFGAYINALKASTPEESLTRTLRIKDQRSGPLLRALRSAYRIGSGLALRSYLFEIRGQVF
jgi:hypothetical protein